MAGFLKYLLLAVLALVLLARAEEEADENGADEAADEGAEDGAEGSELEEMFTQLDADKDGLLSISEIMDQVREGAAGSEEEGVAAELEKLELTINKNFKAADADQNGLMSQEEAKEFLSLFEAEGSPEEM